MLDNTLVSPVSLKPCASRQTVVQLPKPGARMRQKSGQRPIGCSIATHYFQAGRARTEDCSHGSLMNLGVLNNLWSEKFMTPLKPADFAITLFSGARAASFPFGWAAAGAPKSCEGRGVGFQLQQWWFQTTRRRVTTGNLHIHLLSNGSISLRLAETCAACLLTV